MNLQKLQQFNRRAPIHKRIMPISIEEKEEKLLFKRIRAQNKHLFDLIKGELEGKKGELTEMRGAELNRDRAFHIERENSPELYGMDPDDIARKYGSLVPVMVIDKQDCDCELDEKDKFLVDSAAHLGNSEEPLKV